MSAWRRYVLSLSVQASPFVLGYLFHLMQYTPIVSTLRTLCTWGCYVQGHVLLILDIMHIGALCFFWTLCTRGHYVFSRSPPSGPPPVRPWLPVSDRRSYTHRQERQHILQIPGESIAMHCCPLHRLCNNSR